MRPCACTEMWANHGMSIWARMYNPVGGSNLIYFFVSFQQTMITDVMRLKTSSNSISEIDICKCWHKNCCSSSSWFPISCPSATSATISNNQYRFNNTTRELSASSSNHIHVWIWLFSAKTNKSLSRVKHELLQCLVSQAASITCMIRSILCSRNKRWAKAWFAQSMLCFTVPSTGSPSSAHSSVECTALSPSMGWATLCMAYASKLAKPMAAGGRPDFRSLDKFFWAALGLQLKHQHEASTIHNL